ncbi:MAG: hypothetical protein KAV00_09560 [Phycisphaerae bacterium]|nr:hypothetical protein [Phycisphaerae bacterium]
MTIVNGKKFVCPHCGVEDVLQQVQDATEYWMVERVVMEKGQMGDAVDTGELIESVGGDVIGYSCHNCGENVDLQKYKVQ